MIFHREKLIKFKFNINIKAINICFYFNNSKTIAKQSKRIQNCKLNIFKGTFRCHLLMFFSFFVCFSKLSVACVI